MRNVLIIFGLLFMLMSVACAPVAFTTKHHNIEPVPVEPAPDEVNHSTVLVARNSCVQIAPSIWAENIQSGKVFDVYYNDQCADNLGEYCDNVAPQYGSSGHINPGEGSGTVCWVDNIQISGVKHNNGDITVHLVEFN